MKTKKEIVDNWLPRYTGEQSENFGDYILLCNFHNYIEKFAAMHNVEIIGKGKPMQCATANGISIINFGMGSASAATCMDLLSAIQPKAVLFLGKCGGLKRKNEVGDLVLPIAAIRGEGTSNDYFPPEVPALPAFALQKAISTTIRDFKKIIGLEQFTRPIVAFGNMMNNSKCTFKPFVLWLLIWKQRPFLALVLLTTYQLVLCFLFQINQWFLKE